METAFLVKIISAFFISGIWLTGVTLIVEKIGSKKGGLIANLPSNLMISLIYIAIIHSPDFAAQTAQSVPVGMTVSKVFLFAFITLLNYSLQKAITFSLLIWLVLAFTVKSLPPISWLLGIIIYAVFSLITFFIIEKYVQIKSVPKTNKTYTFRQLLLRGLFTGSIVAASVTISYFLPPYLTGVFSTFPAVMLTTMAILTVNQNTKFAQATGKVLLLSSSNIIIYSVFVSFTYPTIGILLGTLVSLIASVLWVIVISPFIKKAS